MADSDEKKKAVKTEQIIDILCLAASYGVLFLLPEKISIVFYLIFGVSAFLFCIGFFRLGLSFDPPSHSGGVIIAGLLYAVFGVLINVAGLYTVFQDHGSARSIVTAILLMIEALVLFSMAGSGFKTPGYQSLTAILFRVIAVLLILFAIVFVIWRRFMDTSVIVSLLLLFESIFLWRMANGKNPFNTLSSEIQTVPGLRVPITELQQTFAGVSTQLGCPWIGKIDTIKQDSIIYGPSEDGFVVYGYYLFGRFYVAGSTNPLFPDPEDAQGHMITEKPVSSGLLLSKEELTEAYVKMFTRYAESGIAQWITAYPEELISGGQ